MLSLYTETCYYKDLPIEIVRNPAQKKNKKSTERPKIPEQTLSPKASDSEDEVPLYWFLVLRHSKVESQHPDQQVHSELQSRPGPRQARQSERHHIYPGQVRDTVIEEEHVYSDREPYMDQPELDNSQGKPQLLHQEENVLQPVPEPASGPSPELEPALPPRLR